MTSIGQMNGLWGLLFRFFLVVFPLLVAFEVWQTRQILELRDFKIETNANRWTSLKQAEFASTLAQINAQQNTRLILLEELVKRVNSENDD